MILRILELLPLLALFSSVPVVVYLESTFNLYWDYVSFTLGGRGNVDELFDFIVVGSGSSGAVVANRLSKHNKVMLIEAGGEPLIFNSIPMFALAMLHRPEVDWMHETVPQKYSMLSQTGRINKWPRGKLLGGTSNLNYMLYVRGSPYDYDNWANITRDDNWNYENVLPFFQKSLNYHGHYESDNFYGKNEYGTVKIEKRDWAPMQDIFVNAAKEAGFPARDLNAPHRTGITPLDVNQKNGKRAGTYQAFLQNILYRKNLKISKYSQAMKIQFDKNNRAEGVWYTRHGKKLFARASKEVIISAGAIDSPKLLMLSGIGPKDHLRSVGLKTRVNLPVGKNLKDHIAIMVLPFLVDKPVGVIPERDFGVRDIIDYFIHGKGPFTCPGGFHTHLLMCTSYSKCNETGKDWPDMQIYFASIALATGGGQELTNGFGFEATKFISKFEVTDSFVAIPTNVQPKSIGEIKLLDKNPTSKLLIDPRYLEHPDDIKVLVEGIKTTIAIVEGTKTFKSLNARYPDVPFPGCEQHVMRSDAFWECLIRHWGMTLYHPVGTCSMGWGEKDPKAVVDSKLRVLKTIGLRVADASIMPEIVAGNTNAPCMMIGDKASDIIRDYWSQQFVVSSRQARLLGSEINNEKCYYTKFS